MRTQKKIHSMRGAAWLAAAWLAAAWLAAAAAAARPTWRELHAGYTFEAYARDFGKEYGGAGERAARAAAYAANLRAILAHNAVRLRGRRARDGRTR
jgi:hypothetical protein